MRFRQLGSSDLQVSEICLGSWLTYGGGVGDERAEACVAKAVELGINFIDTANDYALGAAETFLGDALKDRPRDSYVLATKVYFPMDDHNRGLSRAQIEQQIDDSLARLQTSSTSSSIPRQIIEYCGWLETNFSTPASETASSILSAGHSLNPR